MIQLLFSASSESNSWPHLNHERISNRFIFYISLLIVLLIIMIIVIHKYHFRAHIWNRRSGSIYDEIKISRWGWGSGRGRGSPSAAQGLWLQAWSLFKWQFEWSQWEWLAYHMHAKSDFCVSKIGLLRIYCTALQSRVICTQTVRLGWSVECE